MKGKDLNEKQIKNLFNKKSCRDIYIFIKQVESTFTLIIK